MAGGAEGAPVSGNACVLPDAMFCVGGLFDGPVTGTGELDIGWEDGKGVTEEGGLAAGTGGLLDAGTGGGAFFGGAEGGGAGRLVTSGEGAGRSYRAIGPRAVVCTTMGGAPRGG